MLQGNCSIKLIKLRLHLEPLLLRIPKIFFTVETPMGDLDEKYRFVIVLQKNEQQGVKPDVHVAGHVRSADVEPVLVIGGKLLPGRKIFIEVFIEDFIVMLFFCSSSSVTFLSRVLLHY